MPLWSYAKLLRSLSIHSCSNSRKRIETEKPPHKCEAAFGWYLQESNRGHTDFQSDALPTELRHPFCIVCGCKDNTKNRNARIFVKKITKIFARPMKNCYLCIRKSILCDLQSGCSAVGSALRSGRRGRAFESPHPDQRKASENISLAFLV